MVGDSGFDWWAPGDSGPRGGGAAFSYPYEEGRANALAREDSALLESYYSRRGLAFRGLSQVIEFGVELTRGSDWLAQGPALTITDIIATDTYVAYERLKAKAASNTKFCILQNRRDIDALPLCDLLYAIISLRHTRAVVLAQVLDLLLAKVNQGGLTLLRVPTQHKHYQFMLPGGQELGELDVIPQWKLFEMLNSNGFSLLLVQEEPLLRAADILYHTFLAQRQG